ncbi:MAG TPA: hypothetical protein VFK44_15165 [Bacillales bacterium]|nr:hypothetical protein [Bacillales bacterium]
MVIRFFLLMIGFGLAVGGGVTVILYMNLMAVGHGFGQYLLFMVTRVEFYIFLTGLSLIWGSLFLPWDRS